MKIQFLAAWLLAAAVLAQTPAQPPVQKDNAEVYYHLGLNYYHGLGDRPDYKKAIGYFQRAAALGLAKAQGMLGQCHLKGKGLPHDYRQAADWLRKAAAGGDQIAQFNLGTMYTAGEGVPRDGATARQWYLKAAAQGHTAAMANIGVLHETGLGVKQDFAEAFRWYAMAAKPGLPIAQCNLGQLYATGRGVKQDKTQAAEWYRKAADQNYPPAQFLLSTAYYFGHGVEKDWAKAYQWISLAAASGHPGAQQHRRTIGDKLSPSQLDAAAKAVRDFTAKLRGKTLNAADTRGARTGTGFFVTTVGHLLTSHHLVANAKRIEIRTGTASHVARVVKTDPANGLALLHVRMPSTPLPLGISRAVAAGEPVFTIGFPRQPAKGIEPKLINGKITRLDGTERDARFFISSLPALPGNAGGALVDEAGYAIGMISLAPGDLKTFGISDNLPPFTNHALKVAQLAAFLAAIPEASAKIPLANPAPRTYQQAIAQAQAATVLVFARP